MLAWNTQARGTIAMPDIPANRKTKAKLDGDLFAGTFSGSLEKAGDHDWIRVHLEAGFTYQFYGCLTLKGGASLGDADLNLYDPNGVKVAGFPDGGSAFNSFFAYPVTVTGTYFVDVGEHFDRKGDYSIFVGLPLSATSNKFLGTGNEVYTGLVGERIVGGDGHDIITIGAGVDAFGEQGDDNLIGNASQNTMSGGIGDDMLDGSGGSDILFGDAGTDALFGGTENDLLRGGAGQRPARRRLRYR
jgi:Ca2+-binding RTX toxin-like protein